MAQSYDILTYLLDKSNIQDTIFKQVLYYDLNNGSGLENEVYAPECIIDYTAMFGGEPLKTTNKEWAGEAINIIKLLDASQHHISLSLELGSRGILTDSPKPSGAVIQLPQPNSSSGTSKPDTCTAIANGGAHMVRKAAEGGPMTHNGGRQVYEMIRLRDLEERGENPWRIYKQKIVPIWTEGNPRVTDSMKGSHIVPGLT
ncbi:hypothetical protein SUNI508_01877 [Seiridium unicorne]|uniref:SnoaL-like domain-containing protein n=1 Tax=Seiridium unicorne TaxID=138068 RepID=A0ABR2UQ00_9PEZI